MRGMYIMVWYSDGLKDTGYMSQGLHTNTPHYKYNFNTDGGLIMKNLQLDQDTSLTDL